MLLSSCSEANNPHQELFEGSPQELVLTTEELPGTYSLMQDLSGERPNESLTMNSEDPEARDQYLEQTGRIAGWEDRYMVMEFTQNLPGFILNQVVVYESIVGAQTALNWPSVKTREPMETDRTIGDAMILTMMPFNAPDDSAWIDYRVEFTYNNLLGAVSTYAPEEVATPDYVLQLAESLLENFQTHLSN
jgi:hypothetical protein